MFKNNGYKPHSFIQSLLWTFGPFITYTGIYLLLFVTSCHFALPKFYTLAGSTQYLLYSSSIVLAVLGSHRAHFGCAVCTSTGWDRTFLCILVFLYLIKQRARTQQGKNALIPLQQHSAAPSPCGVFDSSGFALRYSLTARTSWALAKQSQNMWRKHSFIQQLPGNGSFF